MTEEDIKTLEALKDKAVSLKMYGLAYDLKIARDRMTIEIKRRRSDEILKMILEDLNNNP